MERIGILKYTQICSKLNICAISIIYKQMKIWFQSTLNYALLPLFLWPFERHIYSIETGNLKRIEQRIIILFYHNRAINPGFWISVERLNSLFYFHVQFFISILIFQSKIDFRTKLNYYLSEINI